MEAVRRWPAASDPARNFAIVPTSGGLYLGGVPLDKLTGHTEGRWFEGEISEVRLSKTARYIGASYAPVERFTADPDTIALYHCDEGQGQVLADASGNGHDGQIIGATWVAVRRSILLPRTSSPPTLGSGPHRKTSGRGSTPPATKTTPRSRRMT